MMSDLPPELRAEILCLLREGLEPLEIARRTGASRGRIGAIAAHLARGTYKSVVVPPEAMTWEFGEIIAGGQNDRYAMTRQQVGFDLADAETASDGNGNRFRVAGEQDSAQAHASERLDGAPGFRAHGIGDGNCAEQPAVAGDKDLRCRLNPSRQIRRHRHVTVRHERT